MVEVDEVYDVGSSGLNPLLTSIPGARASRLNDWYWFSVADSAPAESGIRIGPDAASDVD